MTGHKCSKQEVKTMFCGAESNAENRMSVVMLLHNITGLQANKFRCKHNV